ncbi:MAG: M48 family metalloprotease [Burkholderiales bacterium]
MRRIVFFILIALSCVLPVTASDTVNAPNLPILGDSEREELSPVMERKVGEEIMSEIRRDPDYFDDAPLLEYLNMLGGSLVDAKPEVRGEAHYEFSFFALRDPTLNAFALPGGFIAVHSGLVLAAQSESELASVMGHEIGHVAQRHIARMLGQQKQDALIPLAALAMAVLASRSSPNAAGALVMGGEGLAIQRQLSFSRDAEREADRVGLQIVSAAGYDTSGMVTFFGRMQQTTRAYTEVPAFLQNHPMTTERIADMQARIRSLPYKQHNDSLDFQLIRARLRVLQDDSTQSLHDAAGFFNDQLEQNPRAQFIPSKYGLAFIALKQREFDKAQTLLQEARVAARAAPLPANAPQPTYEAILDSMEIELKLAAGHPAEAAKVAARAREKFPVSRGIALQYADCLMAEGRNGDAVIYLRDQAQLYRQEPQIQQRLAKAYAAEGRQALQHMALAESYALTGSLLPSLEQLSLARKAPDVSFYDNSVIDAREREIKARWKDEEKDKKSQP